MEQLELRWKSEMTIKWFSLNSIAGTLANPLDYIKHLGCVLGSRMDLSVVVSPSCDLAGKELGRHLPVRHILPSSVASSSGAVIPIQSDAIFREDSYQ